MMNSPACILALCLLLSATVASECPTGCSCRGPTTSDWHTAICHNKHGPNKDFPSSIKTIELRHLPIDSMRQFLKHAPDVTDLIIHDSESDGVPYLPADLFDGLKNLKALTFQTLKQGAVPHGMAASLHGLDKLRFLDFSRNRLQCNCELPHWISKHHVILLGIHSLPPSRQCKKAGFPKNIYKAQELMDTCGNDEYKHPTMKTLPVSDESEDGAFMSVKKELSRPTQDETDEDDDHDEDEKGEVEEEEVDYQDEEDEETNKEEQNEDDTDEEGEDEGKSKDETNEGEDDAEDNDNPIITDTKEKQLLKDLLQQQKRLENIVLLGSEEDIDEGEDESQSKDETNQGEDDAENDDKPMNVDTREKQLNDLLQQQKRLENLVLPGSSYRRKVKGQKDGSVVPFQWGGPGWVRSDPRAAGTLGVNKKPSERNLVGDISLADSDRASENYAGLLHSLLAIRKNMTSRSTEVPTTAVTSTVRTPESTNQATLPTDNLPSETDESDEMTEYLDTEYFDTDTELTESTEPQTAVTHSSVKMNKVVNLADEITEYLDTEYFDTDTEPTESTSEPQSAAGLIHSSILMKTVVSLDDNTKFKMYFDTNTELTPSTSEPQATHSSLVLTSTVVPSADEITEYLDTEYFDTDMKSTLSTSEPKTTHSPVSMHKLVSFHQDKQESVPTNSPRRISDSETNEKRLIPETKPNIVSNNSSQQVMDQNFNGSPHIISVSERNEKRLKIDRQPLIVYNTSSQQATDRSFNGRPRIISVSELNEKILTIDTKSLIVSNTSSQELTNQSSNHSLSIQEDN